MPWHDPTCDDAIPYLPQGGEKTLSFTDFLLPPGGVAEGLGGYKIKKGPAFWLNPFD